MLSMDEAPASAHRLPSKENGTVSEAGAEDIQKRVGELGKHVASYEDFYKKLGASLGTTVNHYNAGYKELGKIDKDVYRISETKIGIELELLDKPAASED